MLDALTNRDYQVVSGVNLSFASAVMVINVVVAALIGGTAGFFGGKPDLAVQRIIDAWMSFPGLLLLLTIMSIAGQGLAQIIIVSEASPSFLGFGLPHDVSSWGGMFSREGRQHMEIAPRLALWPGLCLTIVVYSVNMFGDALRDLLDPPLRGSV